MDLLEQMRIKLMQDIEYIPNFIESNKATDVFDNLFKNINWQDNLTISATGLKTKIHRKMSYVTDQPVIYKYANLELQGETWLPVLEEIRDNLFVKTGYKFNSVLLNLYENGKDEIRWHSDKEEQLGDNPIIACVNLGATRKFWFLNKETGDKKPWAVSNGDLLIMGDQCQKNYLHAILKEKEVTTPRISLTYRWVF